MNLKTLGVLSIIWLGIFGKTYSQDRPNVIFILTDDQGSMDLGVYGADDLLTPNLDRLARRGTRFTQLYAAAPVCSPSRAAILTGRVPHRAGVPGNVSSTLNSPSGLPHSEITLPELLKTVGYRTALVGKWHLGFSPDKYPSTHGFDYNFGHIGGCIDNYSHFYYWRGPNRHDLVCEDKEVYRDGQYFPDMMVEEATQFIKADTSQPFFLYFAMNTPHYPYQGDAEWLAYYQEKGLPYPRDIYNAFTTSLDVRIGNLLDELDSLGIANNTIIVYQSDHGHSTEERAHFGGGYAGPYRGAKFSLFEGGIRVPAIISWPGHLPEGNVRDQFAVSTDWLPTIAELCKVKLPDVKLDGKSLSHVIDDPNSPTHHMDFHWQMGGHWAVRKGKWKLLYDPADTSKGRKFTPNTPENLRFLVNLETDISEQTNLATQFPEIVKELTEIHQNWEKEWK